MGAPTRADCMLIVSLLACRWVDGNELLLCDGCPRAYHIRCLDPPLESVPVDDWICPSCKEKCEACGVETWAEGNELLLCDGCV